MLPFLFAYNLNGGIYEPLGSYFYPLVYINKAKFAKVMLPRFGKCLDGLKSRINYEKQF